MKPLDSGLRRNDEMRAGGNRNTSNIPASISWIPAFAGMTEGVGVRNSVGMAKGFQDGDKAIPTSAVIPAVVERRLEQAAEESRREKPGE